MDDSESLSDLELDAPPKMTFDEARSQVVKEPTKVVKQRKELLRTIYYYCKDQKKHSKIIKLLFWPRIVSFIQDEDDNKIALYGLKLLNGLISNEATHEQILKAGQPIKYSEYNPDLEALMKNAKIATEEEIEQDKVLMMERMKELIDLRKNPIKILVKKITKTDSTLILNEATKALRNLSKTPQVIQKLMSDKSLLKIIREKLEDADPQSQEYILETVSAACSFLEFRSEFVKNDDVIEIIMSQIKSISSKVTYQTLKILRQLAKDEENLRMLQGDKLRLSHKLIYAFKWLDSKNNQESNNHGDYPIQKQEQIKSSGKDDQNLDSTTSELDMIYREISKTFQYILKYYDVHMNMLNKNKEDGNGGNEQNEIGGGFTESDIIDTIINLGRATSDPKTTLNAATSLAHITEILHCNESVASQDAIEFMMDMLKDTKNIKHHRQGCRYFANLSFYSSHRNSLVQNKITAYLLGAIEVDGLLDEDTIKHSAIALANLSSHKDFMAQAQKASKGDLAQISKVDRGKIKPLIHLLDSAKEGKINLIQSACITLCNMASKPSLHQHFVQEPEISTIKNCLSDPQDKQKGNELTRFMIKLVCNLTKNPEIIPHLSQKGFLEILFGLLNHGNEREIFGNVVTAISYMSVQKECQEKIIRNDIISRVLKPLHELHEVDQKLVNLSLIFNYNYRQ